MPKRDYYRLLEVDKKATGEEIEKAYRELIEMYGYDSMGTYNLFEEDERNELLKEIKDAYHILSDNVKRKNYDENVYRIEDYKALSRRDFQRTAKDEMDSSERARKSAKSLEDLRSGSSELLKDVGSEDVNGDLLKKLRESHGMTITDVREMTRINSDIIRIIEDTRYIEMPARTYVLGFTKLYFKLFAEDFESFARAYIQKYDEFMSRRRGNGAKRE